MASRHATVDQADEVRPVLPWQNDLKPICGRIDGSPFPVEYSILEQQSVPLVPQ